MPGGRPEPDYLVVTYLRRGDCTNGWSSVPSCYPTGTGEGTHYRPVRGSCETDLTRELDDGTADPVDPGRRSGVAAGDRTYSAAVQTPESSRIPCPAWTGHAHSRCAPSTGRHGTELTTGGKRLNDK